MSVFTTRNLKFGGGGGREHLVSNHDDTHAAGTGCTGCEKIFAREEFSKTQLNKRTQLCSVCRRVKQEVDTARSVVKSRLNNRSSCYNNYSDEYMDFSSSDSWKC